MTVGFEVDNTYYGYQTHRDGGSQKLSGEAAMELLDNVTETSIPEYTSISDAATDFSDGQLDDYINGTVEEDAFSEIDGISSETSPLIRTELQSQGILDDAYRINDDIDIYSDDLDLGLSDEYSIYTESITTILQEYQYSAFSESSLRDTQGGDVGPSNGGVPGGPDAVGLGDGIGGDSAGGGNGDSSGAGSGAGSGH